MIVLYLVNGLVVIQVDLFKKNTRCYCGEGNLERLARFHFGVHEKV